VCDWGALPPVLRAHSGMIDVCNLRLESPQSRNGEGSEADRTRHAGARGSPLEGARDLFAASLVTEARTV
jgi:hypothetical protein